MVSFVGAQQAQLLVPQIQELNALYTALTTAAGNSSTISSIVAVVSAGGMQSTISMSYQLGPNSSAAILNGWANVVQRQLTALNTQLAAIT